MNVIVLAIWRSLAKWVEAICNIVLYIVTFLLFIVIILIIAHYHNDMRNRQTEYAKKSNVDINIQNDLIFTYDDISHRLVIKHGLLDNPPFGHLLQRFSQL